MLDNIRHFFEIEADHEFYVYLKAHLPNDWSIESEPDASYLSEDSYCYRIYREGELFAEYRGNFKSLKAGSLIEEAKNILDTQIG